MHADTDGESCEARSLQEGAGDAKGSGMDGWLNQAGREENK